MNQDVKTKIAFWYHTCGMTQDEIARRLSLTRQKVNAVIGSLRDEDFASVSIDDYASAYRAVEHLIDLGHRRIAALVPSLSDRSVSELRYKGYCAALKDRGIDYDSALVTVTEGCFEMPEAYRGMESLMARSADFTAVFTLSDTMAIAAIKCLTDHGRRVPEDCSVIAIDGLSMSEYTVPTLTTMVQPAEEMGCESVRILMEMVKEGAAPRHVRVEPRLRQGASVKHL